MHHTGVAISAMLIYQPIELCTCTLIRVTPAPPDKGWHCLIYTDPCHPSTADKASIDLSILCMQWVGDLATIKGLRLYIL